MEKIFIGIDWADKKHDVCFTGTDGRIIKEFRITNNVEGFSKLDAQLQEYAKEQLCFCIETTHGLLFDHLFEFGYAIYPVNPGALVNYRMKHSMARSKNDKLDAKLLSDYIRENLRDLRVHRMNSETTQIIKVLTEDRQRLMKQKIRLQNQLVDALKAYYPVALDLFSDIACGVGLSFLAKHPSPEKAQRLSLDDIKLFLKNASYCKPERAQDIWDLLQKEQPRAPQSFVQAKELFITAMVPLLQALVEQIKTYDSEITKYYDKHPDNDIFKSLPGSAKVIAPRLLASFGDDRGRFENFNNVQCLAGTAPVTKKSGRQSYVNCRQACNKFFRSTIRDMAFSSMQFSVWARTFYDKQRAKGHTHSQALRALGNKWLKIIYQLWVKRSVYDENYHLAQMAREKFKASLAC